MFNHKTNCIVRALRDEREELCELVGGQRAHLLYVALLVIVENCFENVDAGTGGVQQVDREFGPPDVREDLRQLEDLRRHASASGSGPFLC